MPVPPNKAYRDEWGTTAREGYEDRGAFRPPRVASKQSGSPLLRIVGAICIFAGLCWAAYLYTQDRDVIAALQQNHGPLAILLLGAVCSIAGKYLRT